MVLTVDHRPFLVQSVVGWHLPPGQGDQLSNDTRMVLANVERAVEHKSDPPQSLAGGRRLCRLRRTLAGMLTLSAAGESMRTTGLGR